MNFNPKLNKLMNKYCNNCKICIENKYDRQPINKRFKYTVTLYNQNAIVHLDIFNIPKCYFLTTIDSFTKLGTKWLPLKKKLKSELHFKENLSYLWWIMNLIII